MLVGIVAAGCVFGIATAIQAATPSSSGVITGCYDSGGNVKLIDTDKTSSCPKGYAGPVSWNQTGPPGATGATGATGASGPTQFTTRTDNSGTSGALLAPGETVTATVSCNPGEVATGGGGFSQFAGTETPIPFSVLVASAPISTSGTPTGWTVTIKNVDTTTHVLGHVVYVICAST